jgi:hypothetical protein
MNFQKYRAKGFVLPLVIGLFVLLLINTFLVDESKTAEAQTLPEIQIPKQADWIDRGIVISPGTSGAWDTRLFGMISPTTVVKKNGTYYLYYIGADGNRSTDGGPRHRALGVATSTNGINFTKYSANPVITHLPHNNQEEGIFGAGATLDTNGEIVLYYGALWAANSTTGAVDIYPSLATSNDGLNFTDQGYVHQLIGGERTGVGTFQSGGQWSTYMIANDGGNTWDLGLLQGLSRNNLPGVSFPLTSAPNVIGGADPALVGSSKVALFLVRGSFTTPTIEVRTAATTSPGQLSAPVETYTFSNLRNATVFLDRASSTWFMYYINSAGDGIGVKTAPAVAITLPGGAPYPSSTLIQNFAFDFSTVFTRGQGSDQWPMTWADDGEMYGMWGDGFGWSQSGAKQFMGVTRITGTPPVLSGVDVWGIATKNWKPMGIVADANKTMYAFTTTADDGWDGSYGATSRDNGSSWSFGISKIYSMAADDAGVVGIAQFGSGYTGIPSGVNPNYFYIYLSNRTDGKAATGKDVYLARVLKNSIFIRSAHEYYNGLDSSGNPIWSSNWNAKQPIFRDPAGMAYHVNVSYNPGLGRFIYAKGHSTSSLGIFEGLTPWGPWKTVYYGQFRDNFWKFTYQFPQKWMSANGKTMWMSWSGWPEYDNVSFVKASFDVATPTVDKWRRHVVSLPNATYTGNPFELEVDATFTHPGTGITITLPGYYDGSNTWKVGFMPTELGAWTYTTSSVDADLNGVTGSLNAVDAGLPGMLKADPANPKKWKYTDGDYAVPIALRMEFFSEPATTAQFTAAADFFKANNLHMMETRLTEEYGQFSGRHDFVFQGDWRNHQFDLTIWDRMEERMEILAERGLGAHIMFYSDDAGTPGWGGQSVTERLLIRYAVARLAGYPVVWFNTGIDIAEYRNQADINWFGQQIRSFDPYGHPVSSRHGGGSGIMVMSGQTFDSRGDRLAIINDMANYFANSSVPVSMDDSWGENRPSHPTKNFRPEDIRRSFWKAVMAGGVGGQVRSSGGGCGNNGFFHFGCYAQDLESEQWLKLINPFIANKLGSTFGSMVPSSSLVSNGYAIADPSRTKILYFLMGRNDRYDSGNGGDITLRLSGISKNYDAIWFNPRTGVETSAGTINGGGSRILTPPSTDDWVLLLTEALGSPLPSSFTLDFSTFLGHTGADRVQYTFIDANDFIYIAGDTESSSFPTTPGAFDRTHNGGNDGFVAKFSPDGKTLLWSTFLGGSLRDQAYGLRVDAQGFVYVVGATGSSNFPTTPGAYDRQFSGGTQGSNGYGDTFAVKLTPDGSSLVYSTFIGGPGGSEENTRAGLHVDSAGVLTTAGYTRSSLFPTTPGAFQRTFGGGPGDAFIAKLSADGSTLLYSTYFGGSGNDWKMEDIAGLSDGTIIVVGGTDSCNFVTTPGAFQPVSPSPCGTLNGYAAKFSNDLSSLVYSTYITGSAGATAGAVHTDSSGRAIFTGNTISDDFPVTSNAFDTTNNGGRVGFVAILSADGSRLEAATFIGGSRLDEVTRSRRDANGKMYITGNTFSLDWPVTSDAYQSTNKGARDVVLSVLSADLSTLEYSTYMGGSGGDDRGRGLWLNSSGDIIMTGDANSGFPTTLGAYDTTYGGNRDGFFAKFSSSSSPSADTTPPSAPSNFSAAAISQSRINLSWSAASDVQSGIANYKVYRNGVVVDTSSGTSFSDTGLIEGTSYAYQVSAVNGAGLEGSKSTSILASTFADTTSPALQSVSSAGNSNAVTVVYSEPVSQSSSTNIANYAIDNGIIISSASLASDLKTVTLTTSSHSQGITYNLVVNNIVDRATTPNAIAVNSRANYAFSLNLVISTITTASGKVYQAIDAGLLSGATVYTDRAYTFTTIPSVVNRATYIKGANADKTHTSLSFLSFLVNQNVTAYVGYDNRASSIPDWLKSWTNTGQILRSTDAAPLTLYSKDFPSGTVTLGGNLATGALGSGSNYTVIVTPSGRVFIIGDFDGDGKIDITDVSRLFTRWGKTTAADLAEADINGPAGVPDGVIDIFDANKLMANWTG